MASPFSNIGPEYAAPLMPLQSRDRLILIDWFNRKDMSVIHLDITTHLAKLVPEPCWEEEIYDFLSEYL